MNTISSQNSLNTKIPFVTICLIQYTELHKNFCEVCIISLHCFVEAKFSKAATKKSSEFYSHPTTKYLCSSVYWIKQIVTKAISAFKEFWRGVVFININLIIKLLENKLVLHLSNEHGISRDIMNIYHLSVIIVSRMALIVRHFPKNRTYISAHHNRRRQAFIHAI